MQFVPIAPRLSSIPKSKLLSSDTVATLSELVAELDSVADRMRAAGARRHAEVSTLAHNVLSVANAIEDGDANIEIMRDLRERVVRFDNSIPDLELDYTQARTSRKAARYSDEIATFAEALGRYTVNDPHPGRGNDEPATALASDVEDVLKRLAGRNRAIQKRLPRASVEKYAIVKLPVLVVIGNRLDSKKMERVGFEVTDFEGYPVIEDQMLLAIKTAYAKSWDMTAPEVAEEIVETLSAAANTKIVLVSESGRNIKGSNGFSYFWIMPERYFNKLAPLMGEFHDWSVAV